MLLEIVLHARICHILPNHPITVKTLFGDFFFGSRTANAYHPSRWAQLYLFCKAVPSLPISFWASLNLPRKLCRNKYHIVFKICIFLPVWVSRPWKREPYSIQFYSWYLTSKLHKSQICFKNLDNVLIISPYHRVWIRTLFTSWMYLKTDSE